MVVLNSLVNVALVLLILVALVVVHELGHFLAARRAGVLVHEFGVGFPPRARVLRRGRETLYTLNWLPLGGFVRLEGEDGGSDDPRSFTRQRLSTQTLILVAGVAMNILCAWLIFTLIAGLADPSVEIRVNAIPTPADGRPSPAQLAGLRPAQVVGHDAQGNPIYNGSGDLILAINGHRFAWFDAGAGGTPDAPITYLRQHEGQAVTLTVQRADGRIVELHTTLRSGSAAASQGALGIRDFGLVPGPTIPRSPIDAVATGAQRTVEATTLVIGALRDLVTNLSHPTVSGPIGIVSAVGTVRSDAPPIFLVYLIGLLSANLAVVNVLPFPPLDGGRIVMGGIKALARGRLSVNAERATYLVGFGILFAFIIYISFFDIQRLGGGG